MGEKTQICRGARQICPKVLEKFDSKELVELTFLQLWYPVGFTSNKIKLCGLFIWYNLCYLCGISYTETCHLPTTLGETIQQTLVIAKNLFLKSTKTVQYLISLPSNKLCTESHSAFSEGQLPPHICVRATTY